MLKEFYPYFLANEPVTPSTHLEVRDKYTNEVATRVAMADAQAIDSAIGAADAAAAPMREMKAYERAAVLDHCVRRFRERAEELSMTLCIEAGKPIKDARGEVMRLIDTFRVASEESTRIYGEVLPEAVYINPVGSQFRTAAKLLGFSPPLLVLSTNQPPVLARPTRPFQPSPPSVGVRLR